MTTLVEFHPKAPPAEEADPRPLWIREGRIPSLDGLRAVSIGLVILGHLVQRGYVPESWVSTILAIEPGLIGVNCFFAISGFLITTLLLRERARTGRVSLGGFYARRARRILPAYIVFLAMIALLCRSGWVVASPRDWVGALTYTTNYLGSSAYELAHLWSLSLEEQFYMIWPVAFLLLGPGRARLALPTFLLLAPGFRIAERLILHPHGGGSYTTTLTGMDSIAAGCLLAVLAYDREQAKRLAWSSGGHRCVIVGCSALLVASVYLSGRSSVYGMLVGRSVQALALCGLIWSLANLADSMPGRLLGSFPFVALGGLSYSLYLWQQVFISMPGAWAFRFPQNIILALAAAAASHLLIERPFLRLRS